MKPKNPNQLFPMFLVDDLAATKRYYTDKLGFTVTFDLPSYLQVRSHAEPGGPELCFMRPDGFPDGKKRAAFKGEGVVVSIPVDNADAAYDRMRSTGASVQDAPTDKPWGWRSYFVSDPNGVVLDFFHVYKEIDPDSLKA